MTAMTTDPGEPLPSEESASQRVESFIECVETKRRRDERLRVLVLGVGAALAIVAFLTSLGVIGPDVRVVGALLSAFH